MPFIYLFVLFVFLYLFNCLHFKPSMFVVLEKYLFWKDTDGV